MAVSAQETDLRQKAPSTTRCIKTMLESLRYSSRLASQKALNTRRCIKTGLKLVTSCLYWQKAPSARRCIKTCRPARRAAAHGSQKAPSARKCIKTGLPSEPRRMCQSTQKAPSARRCIKTHTRPVPGLGLVVRRHPAPEGALRRNRLVIQACMSSSQKAPNPRRCMKTWWERT